MTGYDIKMEVERRLSSFWSESYGHIYPMLRRLHARTLVTRREVAGTKGPARRKVYRITAAGRRALAAWFATPPARARPRNELLLRVFFGRHAPPGALVRDLAAYHAGAAATLAHLRAVRRAVAADHSTTPDFTYLDTVLDAGERIFEALSTWSADARRRVGARRRA